MKSFVTQGALLLSPRRKAVAKAKIALANNASLDEGGSMHSQLLSSRKKRSPTINTVSEPPKSRSCTLVRKGSFRNNNNNNNKKTESSLPKESPLSISSHHQTQSSFRDSSREFDDTTEFTTTTPLDIVKVSTAKIENYTKVSSRLDDVLSHEIEIRKNLKIRERRSQDILILGHEYEKMKLRYRILVNAAHQYHKNSVALNKNRIQLVGAMAEVSSRTPFEDLISNDDETVKCFHNVYKLGTIRSRMDTEQFEKDIIWYVVEWEHIVTTRIDTELKNSKQYKSIKLHYESKLPSIQKRIHEYEVRGKVPPEALIQKLKRNEIKFQEALEEYEEHAFTLVVLIEEAIICSWKDLFPLIEKMMTWESDRAYAEHAIFKNLSTSLLADLRHKFGEVKGYRAVRAVVSPATTLNQANSNGSTGSNSNNRGGEPTFPSNSQTASDDNSINSYDSFCNDDTTSNQLMDNPSSLSGPTGSL